MRSLTQKNCSNGTQSPILQESSRFCWVAVIGCLVVLRIPVDQETRRKWKLQVLQSFRCIMLHGFGTPVQNFGTWRMCQTLGFTKVWHILERAICRFSQLSKLIIQTVVIMGRARVNWDARVLQRSFSLSLSLSLSLSRSPSSML